ncbi:MAG: HAD-IA family hydrolase, partial [Bacteroidota bacterium]|nr:HAD-IA family hydrolase [Bacteroidota bacterium]
MLNFDAVIFDLDGVITKTALVHGSAWKMVFDEYLRSREKRFKETFREFTHNEDYLPFVDGKPRYKGVASFLESRGIDIPFGDPSDDPGKETVCGLGNQKNLKFNEVLDNEGVMVYDSTVNLIYELKKKNIRIGVASSSKNCKAVLQRVELLSVFETRIDGEVSVEMNLQGKPEPDIFTTACDELGVEYHKAVIVEDAVSGVQAGRNGNFGLVIGLAREENREELLVNGADIVLEDMEETNIGEIDKWFQSGMKEDTWELKYYNYDVNLEKSREALLTVGNGYFGTRGAMEESYPGNKNYSGTYIHGLFNRLTSKVGDHEIENEDLVNISNWLPITFRIDKGAWFILDPEPSFEIEKIHRKLDFRSGELSRTLVLKDDEGRITEIISKRFASMDNPNLAGLQYSIKALNYEASVEIRTEIAGDHVNAGVERYKQLNQKHLLAVYEKTEGSKAYLEVRTSQSDIPIVMGAIHKLSGAEAEPKAYTSQGKAGILFKMAAKKGQEIILDKLVAIHSGLDTSSKDPAISVKEFLASSSDYDEEFQKSSVAWGKIWKEIDVQICGDRLSQKLIRLHLYHMMVTASPHFAGLDSGIPPRGLHGEAYRGHIFWDELYILPLYNIHYPEVVKAALMYRYRRLDEARKYAVEHAYSGAMFPWQSGSDGREETQTIHLNPLSGEWGDDYSSLQRHVSLAIAYNIWNYYWTTADEDFMTIYGTEMFLDICKFWASKCHFDINDQKYHIDRVMGPDEYHEKLPGSKEGGLTDNAYTNIMSSWIFEKAFHLLQLLPVKKQQEILQKLELSNKVLTTWQATRKNLSLNVSEEGIVEQFKGYFDLEELDWEHYQNKYGDIHRLDRILKAEGESPDRYKLSKQPDFLMSFYNLGFNETKHIINGLGYALPDEFAQRNFDYYMARTSHGSTLSRLVHARIAHQLGKTEIAWKMYIEALQSDLVDLQGGTTGEGI